MAGRPAVSRFGGGGWLNCGLQASLGMLDQLVVLRVRLIRRADLNELDLVKLVLRGATGTETRTSPLLQFCQVLEGFIKCWRGGWAKVAHRRKVVEGEGKKGGSAWAVEGARGVYARGMQVRKGSGRWCVCGVGRRTPHRRPNRCRHHRLPIRCTPHRRPIRCRHHRLPGLFGAGPIGASLTDTLRPRPHHNVPASQPPRRT